MSENNNLQFYSSHYLSEISSKLVSMNKIDILKNLLNLNQDEIKTNSIEYISSGNLENILIAKSDKLLAIFFTELKTLVIFRNNNEDVNTIWYDYEKIENINCSSLFVNNDDEVSGEFYISTSTIS